MKTRWLYSFAAALALVVAGPAQAGWWDSVKGATASAWNAPADYLKNKFEKAKADQAKLWGLKLPANFDPARPLVVLIHGLDSHEGLWTSMSALMREQGIQVAYFNYPSNAEIQKSADMLADAMAGLRREHPKLRVDFVTHSMGGLVGRSYIEGKRYTQPVDRFIAIAPPNHGTGWARWHLPLKLNEHYWLSKCNKDWSPLWALNDGSGAAAQMLPDSQFLKDLNANSRREGVRYTIVAGTQNICWRKTANAVDSIESGLSKNVWGLREGKQGLAAVESWMREQNGESDGVISLQSAQLEGVKDLVKLQADHCALVMTVGAQGPVAWDAVKDRLGK